MDNLYDMVKRALKVDMIANGLSEEPVESSKLIITRKNVSILYAELDDIKKQERLNPVIDPRPDSDWGVYDAYAAQSARINDMIRLVYKGFGVTPYGTGMAVVNDVALVRLKKNKWKLKDSDEDWMTEYMFFKTHNFDDISEDFAEICDDFL
jgi:hypothetical protein